MSNIDRYSAFINPFSYEDFKNNILGGKQMMERAEIITICGSMKFANQMKEKEIKLTKDGLIVLMPIMDVEETANESELLVYRNAHKQKIAMSDAIFVINIDGYVGRHTATEIEFASQKNKRIYFLENVNH